MTVLTHMAVGGAVGSLVEGRAAAFGLGVVLHVPLDLTPHYEFQKLWLEIAVVASVFGAMLVAGYAETGIFWGAFGAVLPDLENLLWRLGVITDRQKIFPGHSPRLARWLPHGRELDGRHAWWQLLLAASGVAVVVLRVRSV